MSEAGEEDNYRALIAQRNRRRSLEDRERKLTTLVTGLLAYSAFSNFVAVVMSLGSSSLDVVLGLVIGALYSLGAYRVWVKDDTRWWPVAVPAGMAITIILLYWIGGLLLAVPLVLNVALLILVPIRRRAFGAAASAA